MIEEMITVNREAIERLQMGREDEALILYRTVHVRSRIEHAERNEAPMYLMWSVDMDEFVDDVPPVSQNDDPAALYYYSRPFEFRVDESGAVDDFSVCEARLPSILSYNQGLTSHKIAEKSNREASYREALECYMWSYRILREQLVVNGHEIDMDLVLLALLLNTSHCYEMLDDSETASVWWDRWRSLWMATPKKHHLSREERAFYQARMTRGRTSTDPSFSTVP